MWLLRADIDLMEHNQSTDVPQHVSSCLTMGQIYQQARGMGIIISRILDVLLHWAIVRISKGWAFQKYFMEIVCNFHALLLPSIEPVRGGSIWGR